MGHFYVEIRIRTIPGIGHYTSVEDRPCVRTDCVFNYLTEGISYMSNIINIHHTVMIPQRSIPQRSIPYNANIALSPVSHYCPT